MKQLLAFLLLSGVFISCGSNKTPADIISSERMTTIMWQLMESDEYVNAMLIKDPAKKSSTERMKVYQQVFELNHTSLDEFKKSYQFYIAHPDICKPIFDSITARAARQRIDLMKTRADAPPALNADSIRNRRTADSLTHGIPDSIRNRMLPKNKSLLRPDTGKLRSILSPVKRGKKTQPLTHQ